MSYFHKEWNADLADLADENGWYLYGFKTDLSHASMTDKTASLWKSFRLVEIKIRFFYPLDQRLSAFHSSISSYLIIGHYIFPAT